MHQISIFDGFFYRFTLHHVFLVKSGNVWFYKLLTVMCEVFDGTFSSPDSKTWFKFMRIFLRSRLLHWSIVNQLEQ